MREGVLSGVLFRSPGVAKTIERQAPVELRKIRQERCFAEKFAQEQIQGMVRNLFFSDAERPRRQLVFSAIEAETDVESICRQVGDALSRETTGDVAVVVDDSAPSQNQFSAASRGELVGVPLKRIGTQVRKNLWLVPLATKRSGPSTTSSLHSCLTELRREFEYTVVAGPPAGESNDATALAKMADGIILVLSARHTRRITARKIKEAMEAVQVRLLGTVLSDRVFPMPEAIYRRL